MTFLERLRLVVPLEPLLRLRNANVGITVELDKVVRLFNRLEGVLVVSEPTAVQERRGNLNDWLALADNVP